MSVPVFKLRPYQFDAVCRMQNGNILCGGTGSGKSLTSLVYYATMNGATKSADGPWIMKDPRDLIIITTAKKRDSLEWEGELVHFGLSTNPEVNGYSNKVIVDSWNNIKKYSNVFGAFFIFDEQRLVGSGAWVKAFYKIAKKNQWILLSATPGDSWKDYIPVFVANGFYKNKTEFNNLHVEYDPYVNFPRVKAYHNTGKLIKYRRQILIDMDYEKEKTTHQNHIDIPVEYDRTAYHELMRTQWNYKKDEPIATASELGYLVKEVVFSDESRVEAIKDILKEKHKAIIFYSFDYELDILKKADLGVEQVAEWNGHCHQDIPKGESWIYLVQYNAGAEGWNCITTDTLIFYSQSYSYRMTVQAAGRIDRLNSPYKELYYYHLKSKSPIDLAIAKSLSQKKDFNDSAFFRR